MSTTLSVRFPLGHYHATAWDRSVNEGTVEWPPSPWRLLRALVATWYSRWPDLPAPMVDALLESLGDPPSYWTAPTHPGHTRHYLPDASHTSGQQGSTDLTLDPFLLLHGDRHHLLVRWEVDLTADQRAVLAKLVELVPYLGRAESVCEVRLLDSDREPDDTWWQPHQTGTEATRLLAPLRPIRRPVLELTTVAVRKGRRTLPQDTMWVPYARTPEVRPAAQSTRRESPITAIRFALSTRASFKATHGVLLADVFHRAVARRLNGGRVELLGHAGAATNHLHAHWVPLSPEPMRGVALNGLLVWARAGITPNEVATIMSTRRLSGRRGSRGDGEEGYQTKGFPETTLLLQSVGSVEQVAPELCGPSRVWHSLTPYLPVRHYKRTRGTYEEFLADDVRRELQYRDQSAEVVVDRDPGMQRWALEFRRYRADERLRHDSRPGFSLKLRFPDPERGPLMLGQLSHFGFGIFVPHAEAEP